MPSQGLFKAPSGLRMERGSGDPSADRCGGSAGGACHGDGVTFLLPVELQSVNQPASTNRRILEPCGTPSQKDNPTIAISMAEPSTTDQIAERVERLLLRHAELQRTNALLADQVSALTQERDSLKSRLNAARARIDALLERLPANAPVTPVHKDAE